MHVDQWTRRLLTAVLVLALAGCGQPARPGSGQPSAAPFTEPPVGASGTAQRGNVARTGVFPGTQAPMRGGGAVLWRAKQRTSSWNGMTVGAGHVFIATPRLTALSSASGASAWMGDQEIDNDASQPAPVLANGVLYYGDTLGLHAMDLTTRAERWRSATSSPIDWVEAVAGRVYLGQQGTLLAFDAGTGQELWRQEFAADQLGLPAIADGVAYLNSYKLIWSADVGAYVATLHAISLDGGGERWSFAPAYAGDLPPDLTSPTVSGALVYVAVGYEASNGPGQLFARDAATGAERWTRTFPGDLWNPAPPVVSGGLLYLPAAADDWPPNTEAQAPLFAIGVATGADRWVWYGGGYLRGAAIAADTLYVVAGNGFDAPQGFVAALDPRTGQELARIDLDGIPRSGPIIADGVLYLFGDSGLLAIK